MLVEITTEANNVLLRDLLKAEQKFSKEVRNLILKAIDQGQAKEGYNFLVG